MKLWYGWGTRFSCFNLTRSMMVVKPHHQQQSATHTRTHRHTKARWSRWVQPSSWRFPSDCFHFVKCVFHVPCDTHTQGKSHDPLPHVDTLQRLMLFQKPALNKKHSTYSTYTFKMAIFSIMELVQGIATWGLDPPLLWGSVNQVLHLSVIGNVACVHN